MESLLAVVAALRPRRCVAKYGRRCEKREAEDSSESVGGRVLLACLREEGTVVMGSVPTDSAR
jgi:hypothetical protein